MAAREAYIAATGKRPFLGRTNGQAVDYIEWLEAEYERLQDDKERMRYIIEREELPDDGKTGASSYWFGVGNFCDDLNNGYKYMTERQAEANIKLLQQSDRVHRREGYAYHVISILDPVKGPTDETAS